MCFQRSQQGLLLIESDTKIVSTGVPQGSVLSPLLFNILTRDFPLINSKDPRPGVSVKVFADYIVILHSHKLRNVSESNLQNILAKIYRWCDTWRLFISVPKTSVVSFSRKRSPSLTPLALKINGEFVSVRPEIKFLGFILDSRLSWKPHLYALINKLLSRLNLF